LWTQGAHHFERSCWSTSKHDSYNIVVEQMIRGPTSNHTFKNSKNWW